MYGLTPVGQKLFNTAVVCVILSTLVVSLRIWCKLWQKKGIHTDDYLVVLALALFFVDTGVKQWCMVSF